MHNEVIRTFDLVIQGGTVIDGTRRARYLADVGILGGRIAAIGDLAGQPRHETLDATGKILAPGFIDSHTHDDQAVLSQPDMTFKVSQGVTTVVTGNCGISLAPLRPGMAAPAPLHLLDATPQQSFPSFASYLAALRDRPSAVNVAPMVGHSTLRVLNMDALDRAATEPEIAGMRAMVEEALEAGAIGLSTGTYYPPATAATTEEIIEIGRPLTDRKALYVTHMRNESEDSMAALEETFHIGQILDVPVVISHHKLLRQPNFGMSAITLPRIRRAMQCQCVSLDCYPYTASSTMLHADPERMLDRILISSSEPHPEAAGRDLDELAAEWGIAKIDAARRLQPASAIYFSMDEGDVRDILAFEETMIGSDGLPTGERPHPRLWGTFPRILGHYSRDVGLFPLETAVWKMTGLTARNFGLADRGQVAEGFHADLVVFDAATVRDRADYEHPTQAAEGIDAVLVNGVLTWRDGVHQGARAGQVVARDPGLPRPVFNPS